MSHYLREIAIGIPADVIVARHSAGQMAAELGFPVQRQAEIRLIASELAQNHLDHCTINGQIRLSGMYFAGIPCMMIASFDQGPGIENVDFLLHSGRHCSTTGLGAGLASVRKLADSFALCSSRSKGLACPYELSGEDSGTRIVVRCWPDKRAPRFLSGSELDICGLVAPRSETYPCGDDVLTSGDNRFVRMAMIDSPGLGSGGRQTRSIVRHLQKMDHFWPPDQVLEALSGELACGVSIHILWFDRLRQRLHFAGVGNVSTYLLCDGTIFIPSGQAALTGQQWPQFTETVYPVQNSFLWIQHTDGVVPFAPDEIAPLFERLEHARQFSQGEQGLDISFHLQDVFIKRRIVQDDAAICMGRWQL